MAERLSVLLTGLTLLPEALLLCLWQSFLLEIVLTHSWKGRINPMEYILKTSGLESRRSVDVSQQFHVSE
jgi:hypothetical protein